MTKLTSFDFDGAEMAAPLPIDQEFTSAVTDETNRGLPHHPLTPTQVEAVLLTLPRLGEFTPSTWRHLPRLMRLYRLIRDERDRERILIAAQWFLAGFLDRQGEQGKKEG